ncbi:hypothetical protein ACH4SP_10855 [Streptomyces sp. NPDC021093]|uniref:hypothetical protein n=1 Tax=Streptomyces sp. NPDC021093 TaxID=3365112 RepID=UPI00378AE825
MRPTQPFRNPLRAARAPGRGLTAVCALALPAVLLACQVGLGSAAHAQEYGPAAAGTHAAADPAVQGRAKVQDRAKAQDRATITEGQVKEVGPGGVITYPSVTSCLTVTVRLGDGGLAGAHASLFQVPGELRSDEILTALAKLVGGRSVTAVQVKGAVGAWHPSYFTKAVESYGEGEQVPVPAGPDFDGLGREVAQGLGLPRDLVTVEDVPDGDQIVD